MEEMTAEGINQMIFVINKQVKVDEMQAREDKMKAEAKARQKANTGR